MVIRGLRGREVEVRFTARVDVAIDVGLFDWFTADGAIHHVVQGSPVHHELGFEALAALMISLAGKSFKIDV